MRRMPDFVSSSVSCVAEAQDLNSPGTVTWMVFAGRGYHVHFPAGSPERGMRSFDSLDEKEILALAISLEEEDERIYADFAEGLRQDFPASAAIFDGMRQEEAGHRRRLIELFREKFGEHIPLIRRQDVKGFVNRRPVWLVHPLTIEMVRAQAEAMEV